MADNVTLNSGSGGDTMAADDIGGVKFARSKIVIGADGTNDGDVSAANPLPVTLATGAATAANQTTIIGHVDGLEGLLTTIDVDTGGIATSAASIDTKTPALGQALAAASVPVVLTASQLTTLTPPAAITGFALESGGNLAAIATDAAAIEVLLTAIDADTSNAVTALQLIDDTVATDAAASPTKGQMLAGHDGTNARRVATDSSGHLQIDVLTNALPSGAATEAKQDTLIGHVDGLESSFADAVTALQIIDDWDETNRAAVNLIVGQAGVTAGAGAVAANTPRVTLASDDPGVALLTTIDVDTGSIATNMATVAGAVAGTEMQVDVLTLPSITGTVTANAGTNLNTSALAIETGGNLAACATSLGTLDNIVSGNEAQVDIVAALPAGTNNIGDVDIASIAAGSNLIGDVGLQPRTSGGLSIFRSLDLDETEEEVKGTAGQVYGIVAINLKATPLYLKLYNATAANVTVGSTTPVITIPIPSQGSTNGAGFVMNVPMGIAFSTAISAAVTTGVADADTGAPGANEAIVNILYK